MDDAGRKFGEVQRLREDVDGLQGSAACKKKWKESVTLSLGKKNMAVFLRRSACRLHGDAIAFMFLL